MYSYQHPEKDVAQENDSKLNSTVNKAKIAIIAGVLLVFILPTLGTKFNFHDLLISYSFTNLVFIYLYTRCRTLFSDNKFQWLVKIYESSSCFRYPRG